LTRRKSGNWFQNICQKILEGEGYVVHNQNQGTRFQRTRDVFGADLVALHPRKKIRFIQASQATNILSRLKEYLVYPFPDAHTEIELWTLAQDKKRIVQRRLEGDELKIIGEITL